MRFGNEYEEFNNPLGPLEDDELVADIDDIVIEDDLEDFTPEDAQKLAEEIKEKLEESQATEEENESLESEEEVEETEDDINLIDEVSDTENDSSNEPEVSEDFEEDLEDNVAEIDVETEEAIDELELEEEPEELSVEEEISEDTSSELEVLDEQIDVEPEEAIDELELEEEPEELSVEEEISEDTTDELEILEEEFEVEEEVEETEDLELDEENIEQDLDDETAEPIFEEVIEDIEVEEEVEETDTTEDASSELEVLDAEEEPQVDDLSAEEMLDFETADETALDEPVELDNATRIARLIEEMQSSITQEEVIATPVFESVETNDYNYDLEETPTPSYSWDEQSYNAIEEVQETEITEFEEVEGNPEELEEELQVEEDNTQPEVLALEEDTVETETSETQEEPVVEEGVMPVLTDDDFLRDDEKHLPDKVKEMLIRARKEKLGITDESEKAKKKAKKNKKSKKDNEKDEKEDFNVDNTKALEVATRLDGFETYFYENIANKDLNEDPYIGSFYEEKHHLYEDKDLHGLDLKESVNQGFDAWLAKNYRLYKYKGKAKEIKKGFQDLATIPRFNNREIVPYVEKRGKLVAKFMHYFANDVYYDNSDKKIFAKKHSLYPIIDYDGEKVCYEYLKTIDCPEIENPAKKFYDTAQKEAYELVKSTSDYLAVVAKDYKYDFKAMNQKTGYRESYKLSKTVKPLSIWMLILFMIIQVINLLPLIFTEFGLEEIGTYISSYVPNIIKYHMTISLLILLVPVIAILLMLPTWILNRKVGKYKNIVERLNKILEHTTKIEATLSLDTKKKIKYEKAIYKCKKNKVRIKEKVVKEAAVKYIDETAKLRHQLITKIGLKKFTQALYIILISAILSIVYSMIIVGTLSALININEPDAIKCFIFSGVGAVIAFVLLGLTTKKKGIARWRYHLAVLVSVIITIILLVLI